jgi:serine kinase of HPr protein (carbohydrate metabolism regulator)
VKNPASFLNVSTPTPLRIFTDKERLRNSEERKRLKVARDHSGKPKKPKKVIPEEIPLVDFIPDTPQRNLNVKLDPSNKKEKSERKISNTTNKFNDSIYDQIDVSFDDDLYTTYQSK